MIPTPERPPEGCISELRFDMWFAGELSPEEVSTLEIHLAGCARCTGRRAEMGSVRDAFLAVASVPKPRAPRWRVAVLAGVWAAAAAALPLVHPSGPPTRSKGSERIGFFVKRGEQVARGESGQRVMPGDELRFVYSASAPRYLAILSLDGAARASVYFPAEGVARRMAPGSDQALPASVELDGVLGRERVLALFCAEALAIEPVRQRLERERGSFAAPDGCELRELALEKVPPTP